MLPIELKDKIDKYLKSSSGSIWSKTKISPS